MYNTRTWKALKGERLDLHPCGEGPFSSFLAGCAELKDDEECGEGLFATRDIPAGTRIWQSDVTESKTSCLTMEEVLEMPRDQRKGWLEYCWVINGYFFGPRIDLPLEEATKLEASNKINHSCDANVGFDGDHHLVTLRDIKAGEALNTDYAMTEWTSLAWEPMQCWCESPLCRKTISIEDWRLPELQERYAGHFTSFVQYLIDCVKLPKTFFGSDGSREMNKKVEVRDHPTLDGKGLFATDFIPAGEVVWRFNGGEGTVYSISQELSQLSPGSERTFLLHYGYQLGADEWIAPPSVEFMQQNHDISSYMNHSCDPTVKILIRDIWVASRDIYPGDEITYDYAMTDSHFDRLPECLCGTGHCRGKVHRDDWKRQDVRKRYGLSFSQYLLDRMDAEDNWLVKVNH